MCNKQIVVMKKFFRMVMALSLVGGAFAFTGCTDYEDDINALDDRVSALESTVADLQSKIDAGAVITDVTETADGVTVTLSDGSTFTISNGKAGAPGSVVTIGANGNWFIDGVDTGKPSQGAAGADGKPGADGDDADIVFYRPNMETGNWDKVTISAETGEETVEPTQDSWRAEGVTAVWDEENGTLTFDNVEGSDEPIVINLSLTLKSVTFVPEFSDDNATAVSYRFNNKPISETYLITGTFEVSPASYAAKLTVDNTAMYLTQLKTRAAADASVVAVTEIEQLGNGRIQVSAKIPATSYGQSVNPELFKVSLHVQNPDEGADAEDVVMSEYVGITSVNIDIAGRYYLVNWAEGTVITNGNLVSYNADWTKAPNKHAFYEGYEFAIDLQHKSVADILNWDLCSIEEAAERIGIDPEYITPVYSRGDLSYEDPDVIPAKDRIQNKDLFKVTEAADPTYGYAAEMTKEADVMKAYVGAAVKFDNTFTVKIPGEGFGEASNSAVVMENEAVYTIANKSFVFELDSEEYEWNYANAVALSGNNPSAPYSQPMVFDEVAVVSSPEDTKLSTILDATLASSYVTVAIPGYQPAKFDITSDPLEIDKVAQNVDKIAKVTVPASVYSVLYNNSIYNGKGAVLQFVNTYSVGGDVATDYTVVFTLTLGAMPENQVVNLGSFDVHFSTATDYKYPVKANEAAFAGVASYFDKFDTFAATFANDVVNATDVKTTLNGESTQTSSLVLGAAIYDKDKKVWNDASALSYPNGTDKVGSEYEYRATVVAWYGVNYEFRATATIVDAAYSLEYAADKVTNGKATVEGKLVNGVFTLNQADLAEYFTVKNFTDADDLKVNFTIATQLPSPAPAWVLPTLGSNSVSVSPDASVSTNTGILEKGKALVQWNYVKSKRSIDIKAELMMGTTKLDTKTITVEAVDPVTVTPAEVSMTVNRTPGQDAIAQMWRPIEMFGNGRVLDGEKVSLVNPDEFVRGADGKVTDTRRVYDNMYVVRLYGQTGYLEDETFNGETAYQINDTYNASTGIGFSSKIVKVEVDGVESAISGYDYDPANGTLTYSGNNASIAGKTVTFTVKYSFTHYLSDGAAKTVTVKVNFTEE